MTKEENPIGNQNRESKTSLLLASQTPVSIVELTRNNVPKRPEIRECRDVYDNLALSSLQSLVITSERKDSTSREFLVIGPQLRGRDVNALLYFAAPYKGFGLDTEDIIMDWTDLYKDTQDKLKKSHAIYGMGTI